ncbi:MAG: TraR/DksA C4-type zinc finger protein [Chloroflexota bacterium]|nr:TraR/DksA C4-type zinc finger protein [Chloroflexota bacterium]
MDLAAARSRLQAQREDVSRSLSRLRERLQQSQGESGGELSLSDQHPADAATDTEQRELDLTRSRALEGELASLEEALERVGKGTYGRCIVCGEAIPDERLEVLPQTPYCVRDAAREQV